MYFTILGATLVFGSAGQRSYQFKNLTIQDEGILELKTRYGELHDVWILVVSEIDVIFLENVENRIDFYSFILFHVK